MYQCTIQQTLQQKENAQRYHDHLVTAIKQRVVVTESGYDDCDYDYGDIDHIDTTEHEDNNNNVTTQGGGGGDIDERNHQAQIRMLSRVGHHSVQSVANGLTNISWVLNQLTFLSLRCMRATVCTAELARLLLRDGM